MWTVTNSGSGSSTAVPGSSTPETGVYGSKKAASSVRLVSKKFMCDICSKMCSSNYKLMSPLKRGELKRGEVVQV